MADKIKNSYKFSKSFYDDAITQGKWWSKLYFKLLWGGLRLLSTRPTMCASVWRLEHNEAGNATPLLIVLIWKCRYHGSC
jgi:hypothetical protein